MLLQNNKWYEIVISEEESELDIQYELVKRLKNKWIKCSQNCSVSISRIKQANVSEYWKDEKIKRNTSKKMYLDILAVSKWKVLIIEMKKNKNHWKKQRWYIWAQIDKYKEIWFPVKLCCWREDFWDIINFFK